MTTIGALRSRHDRSFRGTTRLSQREELVTVGLGGWLITGLFLDGYAHVNDQPESFFTIWHAAFYSGFGALAAWMVSRYRHYGSVPAGYGLGLASLLIFGAAGVADMGWHVVRGIEVDLEGALSPPHLVLFVNGLIILSSPLRAAWSDPESQAPSLGQFLPALLSITFVSAAVSFLLMGYSPFIDDFAMRAPYQIAERLDPGVSTWLTEEVQLDGFASILFATLFLMAPTLALMQRWRLPFGCLTLLFGTVATLMASVEGFELVETVVAGVVGGAFGDLMVRRLAHREVPNATSMRIVGVTVPAVTWSTYFGALTLFYSVGWSVELWAGITIMASLWGFALALLMTLPPAPVAIDASGPVLDPADTRT